MFGVCTMCTNVYTGITGLCTFVHTVHTLCTNSTKMGRFRGILRVLTGRKYGPGYRWAFPLCWVLLFGRFHGFGVFGVLQYVHTVITGLCTMCTVCAQWNWSISMVPCQIDEISTTWIGAFPRSESREAVFASTESHICRGHFWRVVENMDYVK